MKNLRLSVHSPEYLWLRELFVNRRLELGYSQRVLAEKMGVLYSFIGKVETGDRRLDVFEFVSYCQALQLDPKEIIKIIQQKFNP